MVRSSIAFLLIGAVSAFAQGQNGKASISEIQSLIRSQKYDQALQRTQAALQRTPNDVRLWTLEGVVLSIQGKKAKALSAYEKALHLSPDYPAALKGAVELLYATQEKRAEPLLERILKADPKDPTALEMLGNLEKASSHCPASVEHFSQVADAIATHPGSLEAYGYCLVETKQPERAIPVFEELAAALPEQTFPKYDLAVVLLDAKQNDRAVKTLEPLLLANPSDTDLLSLASEAYEAGGDTPKAVSLLRQAIVLNPNDANLYNAFAALCVNHESFQVGIDMINAGLARLPDDPSLHLTRGLLYAQLSNYDKAEADFNTAEHLDARQSLSSYAIDLSEMQKHRTEKDHSQNQLAAIRTQLKAHPDSALLHYLEAKILVSEGTDANSSASAEAVNAASTAVMLKPELVDARDLLAGLYTRSGKYDLAIEQCRLALQSEPTDESALYHLIIALRHAKGEDHTEELKTLVNQLSELQKSSLQQDTDKKRFKLVEEQTAPPQ
jgi:tetratricopeptide (TPR) repeat protein